MSVQTIARVLMLGLGSLGLLGSPQGGRAATQPSRLLYFFTTPEAEGGPEGAKRVIAFLTRHAGQVKLRPVLLVHDWSVLKSLSEKSGLYRTLKELEAGGKPGALDIPLYDEEGLYLAERWEIRSVPSYVLVTGGRAHRTQGGSADLEALWECKQ